MTPPPGGTARTAVHDHDRRGILIPAGQLENSGFAVGDRFALAKGQRDLFAITLTKDAEGDLVFDRNGIFIPRSRRVDMLLGGIFETYAVEIVTAPLQRLVVKSSDPGLDAIR